MGGQLLEARERLDAPDGRLCAGPLQYPPDQKRGLAHRRQPQMGLLGRTAEIEEVGWTVQESAIKLAAPELVAEPPDATLNLFPTSQRHGHTSNDCSPFANLVHCVRNPYHHLTALRTAGRVAPP